MKIIEVVNRDGGRVFLSPDMETAHKTIGLSALTCVERDLSVVWLLWRLGRYDDEEEDELLAVFPESDYRHAQSLFDAIPECVRDRYCLSALELGHTAELVRSVKHEVEEQECRDAHTRLRIARTWAEMDEREE